MENFVEAKERKNERGRSCPRCGFRLERRGVMKGLECSLCGWSEFHGPFNYRPERFFLMD